MAKLVRARIASYRCRSSDVVEDGLAQEGPKQSPPESHDCKDEGDKKADADDEDYNDDNNDDDNYSDDEDDG